MAKASASKTCTWYSIYLNIHSIILLIRFQLIMFDSLKVNISPFRCYLGIYCSWWECKSSLSLKKLFNYLWISWWECKSSFFLLFLLAYNSGSYALLKRWNKSYLLVLALEISIWLFFHMLKKNSWLTFSEEEI